MFIENIPNPEELLMETGIPKSLLAFSSVEVDHLLCPLCKNILWKPVACGQDKCYQSFCEQCINRDLAQQAQQQQQLYQSNPQLTLLQGSLYSQSLIIPPSQQLDHSDYTSSSNSGLDQDWPQQIIAESNIVFPPQVNCPQCKRQFKKTSIPIIHNLLEAIKLHCIHENCQQQPGYEQFQKHIIICPFRKINCSGCKQIFLQNEIQSHEQDCQFVLVECKQCQTKMTRLDYSSNHDKDQCIQQQFHNKDQQIAELNKKIEILNLKNIHLEQRIDKMIKGDFENLQNFTFKTSFSSNYQFTLSQHSEARLVRSSYNQQKQKNDFLHFYINHKIKTQSIMGVQWRVKLEVLKGNLLIGICSTLCHYSIDFIINKLGETKKKEWNENKYKHLRKANFTFGEGDILNFQYLPLAQHLRITNECRHLICRFENQEMIEMGENFYGFFSLENQGDQLIFL